PPSPEGDRKGPSPASTLPPPLQRLRGALLFFGYEFFGVGAYIIADSFQFVATGNDNLKVTTQPKVAGIISLVRFVIAYPCDSNERFIGANDTTQGWRILGKAI